MKKVLALVLILAFVVPLAACSGGSGADKPGKSAVYKIGDTVNGELYDFTLKAVSYTDKIEGGRRTTIYKQSGATEDKEEDAYAEDGYKICKIDLTVDYHGKGISSLNLTNMKLDYDDGYTFSPVAWNDKMPTTKDAYSGYYAFNEDEELVVDVDEPLSFEAVDRTIYIFVNEEVVTDTTKSLYLKIELPTESGSEEVAFSLR